MNSKFISFVLSIFILSIALSAVAHPAIHKYKDSSELFKRHTEETCPCTTANALFKDNGLYKVWGIMVFAQNEEGETLCAGTFSDGLPCKEGCNCYDYLIKKCGKVLYNLTEAISPKYRKNGTWPWSTRISDLNLDCDENGVLVYDCEKCNDTTSHHKRQSGATVDVVEKGSGQTVASSGI